MEAAIASFIALLLVALAVIALWPRGGAPAGRARSAFAPNPAPVPPQTPGVLQTLYLRGLCTDPSNPTAACSADSDCAVNTANKFCNPAQTGAGSFCGPTKQTCNTSADCAQNTTNKYCNRQADGSGLCGAAAVTCFRSADCAQNAINKFCAPNPSGEGGLCGPTANADGNVVCNPTYGDGDCAGNATNTYCAAPPGGGGDAAAFRCAPETARAAVVAAAQANMMAVESNYPLGSFCTGDWQCASGHCHGADWANYVSGTCSSKADVPAPPPLLQNGDYCSANSQCASGACGWRDASRSTGTVCCQSTVTVNGAQYCAGGTVSLGGPCWYSSQCPGTPTGITCQGANIAAGTPGICAGGLANGTSCTESSQCTSRFCAASAWAMNNGLPGQCADYNPALSGY